MLYRCEYTHNLMVPCVGLWPVIVAFPDHTHLLFERLWWETPVFSEKLY